MSNPEPFQPPLPPQGYFVHRRALWWAILAAFLLVACSVPLVIAFRRSQDSVNGASCANHFIQLSSMLRQASEAYPDFILPATSDTRQALSLIFKDLNDPNRNDNWLRHPASACPESWRRDRSIGYVYVGDGLRLGDVADKNILILFCPAENHRRSHEHCHAWLNDDGWICVGSNSEMIALLRSAIARGERGEVPYSPRAMTVLQREFDARLGPP